MKVFLTAALPFLIIGICLAVIFSRRAQQQNEDKEQESGDYMTYGMCIGMCLGLSLASAIGFSLGLGISLGMLIGLTGGMLFKK